MHKREATHRSHDVLSIETGKLAKQANGSVLVRLRRQRRAGDRVLRERRAAGHRLPPPDGRLPRVHLRLRAHPRGVLQARRQAGGEGSADEPAHRSAAPPALPERLAPRNADHRPRPVGRRRQRLRRAGGDRRLGGAGAVGNPVREDDRRRCAWRCSTKSSSSTRPTSSAAKARLDIIVAGSRDGIVMVEAGAKEVSEEHVVQALEAGHAAIKQIVETIDRTGAGSRQGQADGRQEGLQPRLLPRGRGEGLAAPRRGDADPGQDRELRGRGADARGPRRVAARRARSNAGSRRRRSSRN